MLTPVMRSILLYGGLVVGVGGFLALLAFGYTSSASKIAVARVANQRSRPTRRQWGLVIASVAMLGGLALAWWSYRHGLQIVFVRDGVAQDDRTIVRRWSTTPPEVPLARPGAEGHGNEVWIVNESSRPVRVESIEYGRAFGFGSDAHVIPPGTMDSLYKLDHVGPDDSPPRTVTVEQIKGLPAYEFRYWLTW